MATSSVLPSTPARSSHRAGLHAVPAPPSGATHSAPQQVDGVAAETVITEKKIGERIKNLRLKKSMGLVELGRHTGLSASFLSQLETGRVVPTLRNLARIAMVFSKDLSYFFEPEPQTLFRIHRGKDRVRLPQSGVDDPCYFFESLGYLVPDRQLDPYFAEFLPAAAGRQARSHQHFGCEFLFVLSGSLTVRHGAEVHQAGPGDAIYFDASTTHSYECSGADPCSALIVTLQQPVSLPVAPRTGSSSHAHAAGTPIRTPRPDGATATTTPMPTRAPAPIPRAG